MPRSIMSLGFSVALLTCHHIHAAPSRSRPLLPRASADNTSTSTSSPSNSGISIQVWAPLVAIVIVIVAMVAFSLIKRRRFNTLTSRATRTGENGSTELTAELLSGASGAATAPARRPRRTRRTPSQISTRSLPAYMEDPGDSEMVLVRGTRDMEDPMPTVQEGDGSLNASLSLNSLGDLNDMSETSQTNLLGPGSNGTPPESGTRPSLETVNTNSGDSDQGLLDPLRHSRQPSAEEIQARGEAPPYFEVVSEVDLSEGIRMHEIRSPSGASITPYAAEAPPDHRAAPSESASEATTRRRSGIRNLAARLSQLIPSSSSFSTSSAPAVPAVPAESPAHTRHHSSNSGSAPLVPARTLSQTRSMLSMRSNSSTTNLTSPSVTSLGPISAPLTHTLVRTEFEYPRAGPSSEQMKFISSRDTMGKFGVPYGLAAQAQALASREGVAAGPAPPPFESPTVTAGPSAARPAGEDAGTSSMADDSERPPAEVAPMPPAAAPEPQPIATSDAESSRSSNRDSLDGYATPSEGLSSPTGEVKHEEHTASEVQSRSPTPTPANVQLTIVTDDMTKKHVPTPPSTPPRQSLVVPGADVPIVVAHDVS